MISSFSSLIRVAMINILVFIMAIAAYPSFAAADSVASYKLPSISSTYTIEYRNTSQSDLFPLMQSSKPPGETNEQSQVRTEELSRSVITSISGLCETHVIGKDTDGYLVRFRMPKAKVRFVVDGRSASEEITKISRLLSLGVIFSQTPSGAIKKLWLDPSAGQVVMGSIKTLLAMTQVVMPEEGVSAKSWDTTEQDQTGSHLVRYTREAGTDTIIRFRKQKISHIKPRKTVGMQNNQLEPAYIPQGSMLVEFAGASGRFTSISGTESYSIVINNNSVGHSNTDFSMRFLKAATLSSTAQIDVLKKHQNSLST
ncbi:MAG: hypothetical protein WCL71_15615, partial [Deltaproteobacteria bacterium]